MTLKSLILKDKTEIWTPNVWLTMEIVHIYVWVSYTYSGTHVFEFSWHHGRPGSSQNFQGLSQAKL